MDSDVSYDPRAGGRTITVHLDDRRASRPISGGRSRSRSQTLQNIERYTSELQRAQRIGKENQKASDAVVAKQAESFDERASRALKAGGDGAQCSADQPQRSISPYQRWKMMPRQIIDSTNSRKLLKKDSNNLGSTEASTGLHMNTKNPYIGMQST